MRVIITGGAGFIGSNLIDNLVKSKKKIFEIICLDNYITGSYSNISHLKGKIKIIKSDVRNINQISYLKNKKIDVIIHLAAIADIVPSISEPNKYIENNFLSTLKVLEFCRLKKVKKLIYSASSSCYGIPKKYPTVETEDIDCKYPYAFSKYAAEKLIMHYKKVYKLNVISLRFFNVYGPRARTTGTYGAVFGVFLAQKFHNKPLTVVGDGTQKRDFIHVNDLSDAIIKCLKIKKNYIFNLGGGNPVSVIKIARMISKKIIFIPKRPGEPDITYADISLARKVLKWEPRVSIEEGVKSLLTNLQDWKKAPVWTPNKIKSKTRLWFKYLS